MIKNMLMAAALVALGGCGGGDTLSQPQADQVVNALAVATGEGFSAAGEQVGNASGQVTVNASASCPGGGTVAVTGSATVNTTNNSASFAFTMSLRDCQVGNTTINGTLTYTGNFSTQGLTSALDGRITVSGGVTGTCVVDTQLNLSSSAATLGGRVCGRSVSISLAN